MALSPVLVPVQLSSLSGWQCVWPCQLAAGCSDLHCPVVCANRLQQASRFSTLYCCTAAPVKFNQLAAGPALNAALPTWTAMLCLQTAFRKHHAFQLCTTELLRLLLSILLHFPVIIDLLCLQSAFNKPCWHHAA